MTAEQVQSLRVILFAVYTKGIMREPINAADFVDASLKEVLDVLSRNRKE